MTHASVFARWHLIFRRLWVGAATPGCERVEFTLPFRGAAVAATNGQPVGATCDRRVHGCIREFDARGRAVRAVRAATSVRRVAVLPNGAVGLPRVVDGCEGDRLLRWARGRRGLLVAARNLAMLSAAGGEPFHRENDSRLPFPPTSSQRALRGASWKASSQRTCESSA